MKKEFCFVTMLILSIGLSACGREGVPSAEDTQVQDSTREAEAVINGQVDTETDTAADTEIRVEDMQEAAEMKMNVQVGDAVFTATLEENAAVSEFVEMMGQGPVSISMSDYAGFEKVGALGRSLTTSNQQTTTSAGDIVLYSGNQIVIFYGSNSWSYTRLGRIDDLTGWESALGSGSVTVTFSISE